MKYSTAVDFMGIKPTTRPNTLQMNGNYILKKVKVYDADKKQLLGEFISASEAGRFLGISKQLVTATIKAKSKNRTNKLGLTIAIR